MTNGTDADLLQVLLCQVREDPLVDLIVAERCSYSPSPRLRSQTTTSIMAPYSGLPRIMIPAPTGCLLGHEATGHFTSGFCGLARSMVRPISCVSPG
jgi:hypothetical protein